MSLPTRPFDILEHTADAKFRAYGATLEEAFAHAIQALAAIATDARVAHARTHQIRVEGNDLRALFFGLIAEAIFTIDTEGLLAATATDVAITHTANSYELAAILVGDDARAYGSTLKAATYSDMHVRKTAHGWELQAVVDI